MNQVVYILDRFARTNSLYNTWIDDCPSTVKIVDTPIEQWDPPEDAGLVLTHEHFRWESVTTLRRVLEASQIPILILCDGILEYRNTWENPTIADGSAYQTIFGHKIACLGRAPARTIEAFGNAGVCEIVGHPKFDQAYDRDCLPTQTDGPFRVLVTTARTPAFNEDQHQLVVQGLVKLKERFSRNQTVAGRDVRISWRLPENLHREIGLPSNSGAQPVSTIEDAIETADAVITTPSTVYLECLIKRRPTALLDFTNSPAFVPAAWRITAIGHINPVLEELADPPAAKMFFQRIVLHDQLELGHDSKQRLFKLIKTMIDAGAAARQSQSPIDLPHRILDDPQRGIAKIENEFDLASLYPDARPFQQTNVVQLQQELVHAVARLGQLPQDIHDRDQQLIKKSEHIDTLNTLLKQSEQRISQVNLQVENLVAQQQVAAETFNKKSEHIERLKGLLEASREQIKDVRAKFRQRGEAMLAAAAQLTGDVKVSRIDDGGLADSGEDPSNAADDDELSSTIQASSTGESSSGDESNPTDQPSSPD